MNKKRKTFFPSNQPRKFEPPVTSFLDIMVDHREFESIIRITNQKVNIVEELRRSMDEIKAARGNYVVAYLSNVVNQSIKANISINDTDDKPFEELIATVPADVKELDFIILTPGGNGTQVAKFVDKLRPRFDKVTFIVPNIAMSAGTILVMSGDDIIMTPTSYIGPIDPQVPNKDGMYIPAQAILTLVSEIQERGQVKLSKGQQPDWTDLQILRQIDPKEIGNAINGSKYSVELVENYLFDYKFKSWTTHSSTGQPVTPDEKRVRAKKIAEKFCNHKDWKSHSRGISREVAWNVCQLKIRHSEEFPGLDRAIRRFWALLCWTFENSGVYKTFLSKEYSLMRIDNSLMKRI